MTAQTDNSVVINAPIATTWEMTNDVEKWPELFAEYSQVDVISRQGNSIRFRLTMHPDENGNVWTWVSERTADPRTHTVRAHRIETGPFEYMNITWEYAAISERQTRMRWVQEFAMKPTAPMNDEQATEYLNRRTKMEMARIKRLVEKAAERVH